MVAKRELIAPSKCGKRYVRRDAQAQFTDDQTRVGRSFSRDRLRAAKTIAERAQRTNRGGR